MTIVAQREAVPTRVDVSTLERTFAMVIVAAGCWTLAAGLLGTATSRILYDVDCFRLSRAANPVDPSTWKPPVAATILRETHSSRPAPGAGARLQVTLSYSDGLSRERERGHDHERAEERGHPSTRRLPLADERLGERDAKRVERVVERVEGRAARVHLPGDRHVDDAVVVDQGQELGDERPDGERDGGDRQRRDHGPPRAIVS